jgi:hypothetical protein
MWLACVVNMPNNHKKNLMFVERKCDTPGFQLVPLVLMTDSTESNTVDIGQTLVNLGQHPENPVNNH